MCDYVIEICYYYHGFGRTEVLIIFNESYPKNAISIRGGDEAE